MTCPKPQDDLVIVMLYYTVHAGCSRASYQNKTRGIADLLICPNCTEVCSFYAHLKPEIVTVGEEGEGRGEQSKAFRM